MTLRRVGQTIVVLYAAAGCKYTSPPCPDGVPAPTPEHAIVESWNGTERPDPCTVIRPESVRGTDDRLDYFCFDQESRVSEAMRAAPAIFIADDLELKHGKWRISKDVRPLTDPCLDQTMCADQLFVEQQRGAWCSAALLDDWTVLTSYHCDGSVDLPEDKLGSIKVVFGFRLEDPTSPAELIVCEPASDPEHRRAGNLVTFKITCPAGVDVKPLKVARVRPGAHAAVYAVGYPDRLPIKFSGVANLHRNEERAFYAPLDIIGGNSGSPVLDALTHRVVGVVEKDMGRERRKRKSDNCYVWNAIAPDPGVSVEITSVAEYAQQLNL